MVSFNLAPSEAESQTKAYDVIIIGGGPGGASAAIYTSRATLKTLVIDKGLSAGALGLTHKIANYPGVKETVSGAELLQTMREQAAEFGTEFVQDKVLSVDLSSDPKVIFAAEGTYTARMVQLSALAGLLVLVQVFAMRWNVVVGGQLLSKSMRGFVEYVPPAGGTEGLIAAIVVLLMPLVALWVVGKLVPLMPARQAEA